MYLKQIAEMVRAPVPPGAEDVEVTSLAYDSRRVEPGSMFFCWKGEHFDGHDFAEAAIAAGAVALVCERNLAGEDGRYAQLVVPRAADAMNAVAAPFYGHPSRALSMLGITGTNGKTTTTFMAESIFRAAGHTPGLIGTIETHIGEEITEGTFAGLGTPQSIDLQLLLAKMRDAGVSHVAMEVTSMGLAQRRVEGTRFDVGVFTNLTQDHLDDHGDFESYYLAKRALFERYADRALINIDDDYGRRMVEEVTLPITTYGMSEGAELRAERSSLGPHGSTFHIVGDLAGPDPLPVEIAMPGPFNVYNALAAAGSALLLGIHREAIGEGLRRLPGVPGRFESISEGQDFSVVVDYAHTPDSLANVLRAARGMTSGRVISVFGCGGDRDPTKRPSMGSEAGALSDLVIATSDNPRSEDPAAILSEVEKGLVASPPPEGYTVMVDRRQAIGQALAQARSGDVVVIAGKGHETGQEFADRKIPFDDRVVTRELLRELLGEGGIR